MNSEKTRKELFKSLNSVLTVSEKKFKMDTKKDGERRSWGRLLIQAVSVYGKIMEVEELEEIRQDIDLIKKELHMNV